MRREQRALRDALRELRRQLEDAGEGAAGGGETAEDRAERERALSEAEGALDRAGEAMGRAEDALRERDSGLAADEQMRAADEMRDGGRFARRALRDADRREQAEADANGDAADGLANGDGGQNTAGTRRDPFGREVGRENQGGSGDGFYESGQPILGADGESFGPGAAQEILEELRRRLGERERPSEELDYLERLIERFR